MRSLWQSHRERIRHINEKDQTAMGVERAVTRWHLQQQQIHNEITTLETKLASARDKRETDSIHQQLTHAREKLHQLGPCPKPMMG
jgi:hypothetical protein